MILQGGTWVSRCTQSRKGLGLLLPLIDTGNSLWSQSMGTCRCVYVLVYAHMHALCAKVYVCMYACVSLCTVCTQLGWELMNWNLDCQRSQFLRQTLEIDWTQEQHMVFKYVLVVTFHTLLCILKLKDEGEFWLGNQSFGKGGRLVKHGS